MERICALRGRVRSYPWGSTTAIASFLGRPPSAEPEAELWLGAHEQDSAEICVDGDWRSLDQVIASDPEAALGRAALARFGARLPFLFKVLAVARPLSIQAHPDAGQARAGFEREEARGVPRDAPERNYRDPSAKPELVCALTRFEALRGFRSPDALRADLERFDLAELVPGSGTPASALREFFEGWFRLHADARRPWLARAQAAAAGRDDPTATWLRRLARAHPDDPGVLAPLFLNRLVLEPGQAMFLPAGELHCYLEGAAVELMANSDNVLRGGLTPKHVDVPELLRVLRFHDDPPRVIEPAAVAPGERRYEAPTECFALSTLEPRAGRPVAPAARGGPEILACASGAARVVPMQGGAALELARGGSAWVPAAAGPYRVEMRSKDGQEAGTAAAGGNGTATLLYRAAFPVPA